MNKLKNELQKRAKGEQVYAFFAPARINLIGEHIDYVGGKVLPAAIDLGIEAYACKSKNVEIKSLSYGQKWIVDDTFYRKKKYNPKAGFMNFVYGAVSKLKPKLKSGQGFKLILDSKIPVGSGLASSAAFGVLIIEIFTFLYDIKLSKLEKAKLFRGVENDYIGVKSGIMDQFAIIFGQANKFVLLDTDTLEYSYVPVETDKYDFLLISSNKKRELTDSKYNERVAELRQISGILDFSFLRLAQIKREGALENVKDPTLNKRLKHIMTESNRVDRISRNIQSLTGKDIGRILTESHFSLANDYEVSCEEIEFIHSRIIRARRVFGARMIGAGFGGCILVVVSKKFKLKHIKFASQYKAKFGYDFSIFNFNIGDGIRQND